MHLSIAYEKYVEIELELFLIGDTKGDEPTKSSQLKFSPFVFFMV